jgi:hypothetical protein
MTAVLARIIARYVSGALVAYGIIPQDLGAEMAMDPDLALFFGAALAAITEGVYAFAKRRGWTT